jgi:hypothetical protein
MKLPSPSRVASRYRASAQDQWGYHATFLGRLGGISSKGLVPSSGSQFNGGYSAHSKGRVFLSGKKGLLFWLGKMEDIAQHESDFTEPENLGWTPVALRVSLKDIKLHDDELGRKDSYADAWFSEGPILPGDIEVWDGSRWASLRSVDTDTMLEEAQEAAEWESDSGEPYDEWGENDGWFTPNFEIFYPR